MSFAKRAWSGWVIAPALACAVLGGCSDDSDDDGDLNGDGGADSGISIPDGGMDASTVDSGWRSDAGPITEKVVRASASDAGHDRFYGVTYDSQGNIYAVGNRSETTGDTADFSLFVAKFSSAGVLDPMFGQGGFATINVTPGGRNAEFARGIVVQKSGPAAGKIVIAGEAEHAVPAAGIDAGALARDTDIVLVRFNPNGQVDTTFGAQGIVRHDLGTGVENIVTPADGGTPTAQLRGADATWSLSETADGKLVIHGVSRAQGTYADGGARTDTDYTLLRLTADGALDTTFAGTGIVRTDVGEENAGARAATVLGDGSILAAGYTTSTALGRSAQQPVLYKVKADGTPDTAFATQDPLATPGVWHDFARADMKNAEAYGAAPQGSKFVTVGYGPTPGAGSAMDWVFFRFNGDGTQDKTFGTDGAAFLDVAGYGDNGRAVTTLPDNRILAVGSGRPAPATPPASGQQPSNVDGVIAVLGPDGQPDESFGTGGRRLYSFGDADAVWSCQVAPGGKQAAAVGIAGAAPGGADDGVLILLTIP